MPRILAGVHIAGVRRRFLILELERDVAVLTLAGGPELRNGVGVEVVESQAASRKECTRLCSLADRC